MILAPRLRSTERSLAFGGVMNCSEFSAYVAFVAWILASIVSTGVVSAKVVPLKVAGSSGGTCQMNPTAPESSSPGTVKFQNRVLPLPMPASHGQLEKNLVPVLLVTPAKRCPITVFCAALRQVPSRAPVQVGT